MDAQVVLVQEGGAQTRVRLKSGGHPLTGLLVQQVALGEGCPVLAQGVVSDLVEELPQIHRRVLLRDLPVVAGGGGVGGQVEGEGDVVARVDQHVGPDRRGLIVEDRRDEDDPVELDVVTVEQLPGDPGATQRPVALTGEVLG